MSHSTSRASIQYSRLIPPGCGCGVVKVSRSVGPAPACRGGRPGARQRHPAGSGIGLRRVARLAQEHALAADGAEERAGARGQETAAGHAIV